MKKASALVLVLALAFLATACQTDPEKDAKTVVAEVGSAKITKGEALEVYDFMLKQTIAMYEQYYGYYEESAQILANVKASTLNLMTDTLVFEQKLEALGIGLTEEELALVETNAQEAYDEMIQSFVASYGATEEDAVTAADQQGYTLEAIRFYSRRDLVDGKLREAVVGAIGVDVEEIVAKYNAMVADKTETYAATPGQFGSDLTAGETIYVRPEGYRYVKNLVIGIPEEIMTEMRAKDQELYDVWYYQYMLESQLSSTTLSEEEQAYYEDLFASYDEEYSRLESERDILYGQGIAEIQEKAEEVLALCLEEGADFDAIMETYNSDTPTGIVKANGYPVCAASTSYVASFTEGAMALENVGDISGLIGSDYGYHILLYAGDIEPGVVPLESIRDSVAEAAKQEKQSAAFEDAQAKFLEEAKVKTYPSRL